MPSMDGRNAQPAGDSIGRPDASGAPTDAVAGASPAKRRARGTRSPQRARRQQRQVAVEAGAAGEGSGLGALNRHLTQVVTQWTTAQHLIGRLAAERDALRHQLATLQGVPVEDVMIPAVGASPVPHESAPQPDAALAEAPESRIDRIRRRLPRIRPRLPRR
jgi:hypothetical protein